MRTEQEISDFITPLVDETLSNVPVSRFRGITSKEDYLQLWDDVTEPIIKEAQALDKLNWRKEGIILNALYNFFILLEYLFDKKIESHNPSFNIPPYRSRGGLLYQCPKCGRYMTTGARYRKYCPYCLYPFNVRTMYQKWRRAEEKKKREPRFCQNPKCKKDITNRRTDAKVCSKKCLMVLRRNPGENIISLPG